MSEIIILDFETSGLNPYHDDIIEIGAKVFESDKQFSCLIQPKSNEIISETITSLTGISNRMLKKEGLTWQNAYQLFNEWLLSVRDQSQYCQGFFNSPKLTIVSHNGESFDFLFLKRIFNDLRKLTIETIPIQDIIFIDTLLLSRRLLSNRSSYRQGALCSFYKINFEGSHRAFNDVIALEQLFRIFSDLLHQHLELISDIDIIDHPQRIRNFIHLKD
jgi:DNA polymerase III alpha subunit (gram-positive type)